MNSYLELLAEVLHNGNRRLDRTRVGTKSLFGRTLRHDLKLGFPLLTTKKVFFKAVVAELLWFLSGSTNVKPLQAQGVHIWDKWADKNGELGRVYGAQWRNWRVRADNPAHTIDQIAILVDGLKHNPNSRRHILSSWNVGELDLMALPPCHLLAQFYVANGHLSCQVYQRSADIFLGVPFNLASYALLTKMLAQVCLLSVRELIFCFGDLHLYNNHTEQAKEQLAREPLPLPTVKLNPKVEDIFAFSASDITLQGYKAHPAIQADVAV